MRQLSNEDVWLVGLENLDGKPVDLAALQDATTAIRNRGPDDKGYLFVTGATESCGGADLA